MKDPLSGHKVEKSVFVVFFAGERARSKILKVPPKSRPTFQSQVGFRPSVNEHTSKRLRRAGRCQS